MEKRFRNKIIIIIIIIITLETPDMAQSGRCLWEALGTSGDTATDCRLCLTHWTENIAWPRMQKKKEKKNLVFCHSYLYL